MTDLEHHHHPDTSNELRQALREIEAWEADQKDLWFWEKLGRLPFQVLDRLTPKFLNKKIGEALDELGNYLQAGGRYLISEKGTLRHVEDVYKRIEHYDLAEGITIASVGTLPLKVLDQTADEIVLNRSKIATLQGATTGIGGILTLAIDIPAILGLSLKTIQEVAICYGYDPKDKQERIFTIKVLQFSSSDIVGKKAILEELGNYASADKEKVQMISQLQGWREVFATYRDNWGWKKLFQLIPIAGILFGAWINRGTLKDVGEAAKMLYRKRRILERLNAQVDG
ncbi:EcsC family protein [Paenibacillus qinlingensis]|uniref:EcsC family protein n=1 Tax=Paenibacillus qinlingensis TaxID=1837343 RepID=UPI001567660D|nr:EcsC family protein [Paenibacillus qinlingensis]NQX63031.1 EcsC family protein [Paenibacillus qinlingensis]